MSKTDPIYFDSSILFFGSGQIGYRWAVKMCYLAAIHSEAYRCDTFFFNELLDRFAHTGDRLKGESLFRQSRVLFDTVEEVNEEDFVKSHELFKEYPQVNPRVLIHAAVMKRTGVEKICSTFASGVEFIEDLRRVNLMEKVEEVAEYCR